jgi:signal transduction histidine kinase
MSTVAGLRTIVARDKTAAPPTVALRVKNWFALAGWIALSSTLIGILFSVESIGTPEWRHTVLQSLAMWWGWGVMTPLIVAVDRRLPFTARELGPRVTANLLAGLVFTPVYFYLFTWMRVELGVVPANALRLSQIASKSNLGFALWCSLIYWIIVGALQAYRYYERYLGSELRLERMEKSYSQARLNALRMQLDPHFLFNALNTISSHVERDPKLTRRMIEHLGDLLRMSLETKDRQTVPLAEEMAFLDHYLAIQKIRFGSQLNVQIDIAPEVRYASVPSLIIQPLVENAIRHGISKRSSGGTVTVSAHAVDGRLAICVTDDGVGLPPGWTLENSQGLGLSVTRERIAGLHPDSQSHFAVRPREEGGTLVEIVLPLEILGDKTDDRSIA